MNVNTILDNIKNLLDFKGQNYDKNQERSMKKTVDMFNIATGKNLTEVEGWFFMQILKNVRLFSNIDQAHVDSYIDDIAYSTLKAECKFKELGLENIET
jgi:hypothetical protein